MHFKPSSNVIEYRALPTKIDGRAQDSELSAKVQALINTYNVDVRRLAGNRDSPKLAEMLDSSIKWTRALKGDLRRGITYTFEPARIINSYYRPFVKRRLYFSRQLNEMVYRMPQLFGPDAGPNVAFGFAAESRTEFAAIAFRDLPNKDIFMPSATQVLALYRYEDGERKDNVTDWALAGFRKRYRAGGGKEQRSISRDAIFHYTYAVLHDPVYREKYAVNLKREFPRIPFYADFWQWSDWGRELMELHIGFESVEPFALRRTDVVDEKARAAGLSPKAVLKADKPAGVIRIDSETALAGLPQEAWDYKLGNRSALEWILDQYRETKPRDPTIRARFDTYRLADYKEKVIDLLARVTTVSLRTVAIVEAMRAASR
ncbi:MAG: hypothetical protein IPI06_10370 [Gammaproteobacteria bacterium]|nr:hypothetical protein [Gammaproteobacteria bacterium]